MAVRRREGKRGVTWQVLWRDERGKQTSRSFSRKEDADAYEAKVRLAKRQGELAQLDKGKQPLRDFVPRWQKLYAQPQLADRTIKHYTALQTKYLLPELGHLPLRQVTAERIQEFQAKLTKDGVGDPTVRKTIAMLQGMLRRAVEWGYLARNPAQDVRKVPQRRTTVIEPLAPTAVERIRGAMLAKEDWRDAALVSVLAYSGVRPGEALALRWDDVGTKVLRVERSRTPAGEVAPTKTGKTRTVQILKPLAADLADWRKRSAPADGSSLVFPNTSGQMWTDTTWRNWRDRRFDKAAKSAGLPATTRPYDLRHSFASLLLAEQRNPVEVAAQLGHSPETLLREYAHVIEELRGKRAVSAEAVIAKARKSRVDRMLTDASGRKRSSRSANKKVPALQGLS